jgi:hypothetical protein
MEGIFFFTKFAGLPQEAARIALAVLFQSPWTSPCPKERPLSGPVSPIPSARLSSPPYSSYASETSLHEFITGLLGDFSKKLELTQRWSRDIRYSKFIIYSNIRKKKNVLELKKS